LPSCSPDRKLRSFAAAVLPKHIPASVPAVIADVALLAQPLKDNLTAKQKGDKEPSFLLTLKFEQPF